MYLSVVFFCYCQQVVSHHDCRVSPKIDKPTVTMLNVSNGNCSDVESRAMSDIMMLMTDRPAVIRAGKGPRRYASYGIFTYTARSDLM